MPYSSVAALPAHVKRLPAKKQRQWIHVFNSAYSSCMADEGDGTKCESSAFAQANGVVKGSEVASEPEQMHEMLSMQLEKADPRVNYRVAPDGAGQTCGDCRFFDAMCMKCAVVEGTIDSTWVCSLWTKEFSDAAPGMAMYREPTFQVFVEAAQAFAAPTDFSKPQWIPFLPVPGRYQHTKYGEVVITPGQNREMVQSVKDHVYQEHIPLDAEHETKLSGAVAWIKDMRMNDNGSADAFVEFNDRGQKLLAGDAYKYISPEWFSDWRDPATGIVHRNIVIGGAITTRPFFKDRVLRALVASEAGNQIIFHEGGSPMPDPKGIDPKAPAADPKADDKDPKAAKTFTEEEHNAAVAAAVAAAQAEAKKASEDAAATAAATEAKSFGERMAAAEALAASEKTAREAAELRVANLEKTSRIQRFTDLVAGRRGSGDGAAWVGDATKHVTFLEGLVEKVGEADPMVASYIEQQTAIAAQAKDSSLFREFGSAASTPAGPSSDSVDAKLEALAKARQAADPEKKKTYQQAYAEVMESDEAKALYQQEATRPKAR